MMHVRWFRLRQWLGIQLKRRLFLLNIFSSQLNYLVALLFPLAVIPHLSSRLGDSGFGVYASLVSLSLLVVVLVDFGFGLKGPSVIREVRNTHEYLTNALVIRLLVWLSLLLCCALSVIFFNLPLITMLSLLASLGSAILPPWMFLALGRGNLLLKVNIISRTATLFLIIWFVNDKSHIWLALFLHSLPSLFLIFFLPKLGEVYKRPVASNLMPAFKEQYMSAVAVAGMSTYTAGATYFASMFLSASETGAFYVVDRLLRVVIQVFTAANQFIQARVDFLKTKKNFTVSYLIIVSIYCFFAYVGFLIFGEGLFRFLGADAFIAGSIVTEYQLIVPLVLVSNFLGVHFLVSRKDAPFAGVFVFIGSVILVAVYWIPDVVLGLEDVVRFFIVIEVFVLLATFYMVATLVKTSNKEGKDK